MCFSLFFLRRDVKVQQRKLLLSNVSKFPACRNHNDEAQLTLAALCSFDSLATVQTHRTLSDSGKVGNDHHLLLIDD